MGFLARFWRHAQPWLEAQLARFFLLIAIVWLLLNLAVLIFLLASGGAEWEPKSFEFPGPTAVMVVLTHVSD